MTESRRLPARVYWVRRFVVLGIPLIIIAVVVWLVAGRDSGTTRPRRAARRRRRSRRRPSRKTDDMTCDPRGSRSR